MIAAKVPFEPSSLASVFGSQGVHGPFAEPKRKEFWEGDEPSMNHGPCFDSALPKIA